VTGISGSKRGITIAQGYKDSYPSFTYPSVAARCLEH
jgi:hypothetical protein